MVDVIKIAIWKVTLLLFVILPFFGYSQQDPIYTQHLNNTLLVQPAYAGIHGYTNLTVLTRHQFTEFDGYPLTNTAVLHTPVGSHNAGIGFSIYNERLGPVRQNGVYIDYAYHIKFKPGRLAFGLKGGFNLIDIRLSELEVIDPGDPGFVNDVFRFLPNFGVGVMWHTERLFIGASIPKVLSNEIQEATTEIKHKELRHFYGMAGYVFNTSGRIQYRVSGLARYAQDNFFDADLSLHCLFFDKVWLGGTYRVGDFVGALIQFHVSNQIKIGYAYDTTSPWDGYYNAGTHELMISIDFTTKKRLRERYWGRIDAPRYF